MRLSIREIQERVPGQSHGSVRLVREWICPECDYFEEADLDRILKDRMVTAEDEEDEGGPLRVIGDGSHEPGHPEPWIVALSEEHATELAQRLLSGMAVPCEDLELLARHLARIRTGPRRIRHSTVSVRRMLVPSAGPAEAAYRPSTTSIAASTIEPPRSSRVVTDSPPSSTAKSAANTGSMLMMIAARVGGRWACAQVWPSSASAPAT